MDMLADLELSFDREAGGYVIRRKDGKPVTARLRGILCLSLSPLSMQVHGGPPVKPASGTVAVVQTPESDAGSELTLQVCPPMGDKTDAGRANG